MNNDLISREALKKAFEKVYPLSTNEMGGVVNKRIYDIIDNAPTVETDIEVVAKDAYKQGYTDGWKERYGEPEERPQGEWIELSNHRHKCSKCNNSADALANLTEQLSNFCPKCGADMRDKKK